MENLTKTSETLEISTKSTKSKAPKSKSVTSSQPVTSNPVSSLSDDRVSSIKKTIEALLRLGLSPLPVAPRQDNFKFPKKDKGKIVYVKDEKGRNTDIPLPSFCGKRPSYLDRNGYPRTVEHRDYQNEQPTKTQIDLWWSNPDNGIGSLGSETLIWIDIDLKHFADKETCDRTYKEWLEKYTVLSGAWKEKSQSGGYRILVEVDAKPTFTNFCFPGIEAIDNKNHGECLGFGRFAVLSPTKGTSDTATQDYSLIENHGCKVNVGSLEEIGLVEYSTKKREYKTSQVKSKTLSTPSVLVVPDVTINPSLNPIPMFDLLAKSTKSILDGTVPITDRSDALTTCFNEIYGWTNWLNSKGLAFDDSHTDTKNGEVLTLHNHAVMATNADDKGQRVFDSIIKDLDSLVPACYKKSDNSDLGPWQQIKRVDLKTFEAKCPIDFKETIEILDTQWRLENTLKTLNNTNDLSPLDAARQGKPLPVLMTVKKNGSIKVNLPSEADTARYINVSSDGRIAWHPLEKRFYTYKNDGGYWDYSDEVMLKRLTSKVLENTSEGDVTGYLNFSYIPQVVKSLNIHYPIDIPEITNKNIVPFIGTWFDILTKDWIEPNKDNFVTSPLPIRPIKGDYSRISEWLLKAVKGDQGHYNLLRCLFWLVLSGDVSRQVYFEIVGIEGTGKSLLTKMLQTLVGKENTVSTLMERILGSRFEQARLHRKRLILFLDQKSFSGDGSGGMLKNITGDDPLTLELKGDPNIGNFDVSGILVITANDFMKFSGDAAPLDRRRIPIKFDVQPTEEEKLKYTNFGEYLCEALPEWIDHILELDRDWVYKTISHRKTLTHDARIEQMLETNPIAQWLSDRTVVVKGSKTTIGDKDRDSTLYGSYHRYCDLNIIKPISTSRFRNELTRQLQILKWSESEVSFKKITTGMTCYGLGLKDIHIGEGVDPVTREPNEKPLTDLIDKF